MNNITNKAMITAALAVAAMLGSCDNEVEMRYPPKYELPELPEIEGIHTYKAPMYWSV